MASKTGPKEALPNKEAALFRQLVKQYEARSSRVPAGHAPDEREFSIELGGLLPLRSQEHRRPR